MISPTVKLCLGVTYPKGFRSAGVAASIKYRDRKDFALLVSGTPASAAGVFTTNAVAAAPVRYDREAVKRGRISAIAVNTGFANACTGETGEKNTLRTAEAVSKELGIPAEEVAVCSTGVIGVNLPMDRIEAGIKMAAAALDSSPEAAQDAAEAIMTTDTVPKQASLSFFVNGKEVRLGGMSKGAGMIEPYMATLLAFITCDAAVAPADLDHAIRKAVSKSFNCIVVDNDRSTNDTLIMLANGASGVKIAPGLPGWDEFLEAVEALALALAKQHVMDGEGASKFVTLSVTGARSDADAALAARAIARSMLVKTSWYGTDPNWGRVICAVGYSGAEACEKKTTISYDGIPAFSRGTVAGADTLLLIKEAMGKRSFAVDVDLGLGEGKAVVYTSDLTHEYVNINAEYTT